MRYVIEEVVWSVSNDPIFWKKGTFCLMKAVTGKYTYLYGVFFLGTVSNISFYRQERCSSSCLLYVCDVTQIFAVVHFEAPPACPHVEVRIHTNVTHSATLSKHTCDMQHLLSTPRKHTRPLLQMRQYTAGVISLEINNKWVHGKNS